MKRVLPWLFFLAGCLLLTFALAIFGAYAYSRLSDSPGSLDWKPPLQQVDSRALAPGTVLLPLTGTDSADALGAALDQAHLENAYALIAYDPDLSDATRVGALLQLGARYATAKDSRKAAACYQSAALLATLSPALSDPARMDTYQQASAGLRSINATEPARFVTDQAYLVAQYSPALQRDTRARRLAQVAEAYAALGASTLAAQARAKSIEAGNATNEGVVTSARAPFSPTAGKLSAAPEVDSAKQKRIAAAQQLADELANLPSGAEWSADLVAPLSDALMAEDSARQVFYERQVAQAQDPAAQIALLRDKISWLAVKYRVARGAFGKNLVAEWSQDPTTIADALGNAWGDLFRLFEAQAGGIAQPQDANQATADVVRQALIVSRWGWSGGVDEKDLRDTLDGVTQKLMQSSTRALRLDAVTRSGKTLYLLVPDELYGQGEQAMPK